MTSPTLTINTACANRSRRRARFGSTWSLWVAVVASVVMLPTAHAEENGSWRTRFGFGGVKGSGQIETETRAVTGFQGVALQGSIKLVLRQAASSHVEVRADHNLLPLIETRIVDRNGVPTLLIGSRDNASWSAKNDPVVTVDVTHLKALAVSGSGDASVGDLKTMAFDISVSGSGNVDMKHLEATELAVKVSGSGNVKLAGQTNSLAVKISGSGDVSAFELASEATSVNVSGSGNAKVDAKKTLAVAVSGSGDVAYSGNPTMSKSIGGSGTVRAR